MRSDVTPLENSDPAFGGAEVVPNDDADLPRAPTRGVYIGTAGDVKVTMINGDVLDYPAAANGEHPWRVTRIWATGTTAAGIRAMY